MRRVRAASLLDPLFYVQVVVILFLCALIVYPAAILLGMSLRDEAGGLTLKWFAEAYGNARNLGAILNTLVIASGTAVAATIAGTFLAWAVVRTDMPGRRLVEMASVVPFISTPFIGALAWVLLASPGAGLLNQLWSYLGGPGVLLDIYSLGGMIFVESLYEMPFVFLMVAGALRSMDPTLEEASLSAGAGLWRTTTRVTLPLVLPAILGGALLVFVLAAEQFGVPAVLGTPARIRVLTTSIVESQASYPIRLGLGAALSVTLLAIALVGLWLQRRMLGRRSYTTIGGKGAQPRRFRLGRLRWAIFAACLAYLMLAVALPYAAIFLSSIRTIWTADFRWDQWTLENYRWVFFDYPITQRALVNSLFLAVVGASVTMLLCAVISFLSLRTRLPGRRALDYLSMVPMGFPGVVLAFGLLHAWIHPPVVLYGTIWILFAAYMTRYIPIGVRATSATLVQIHPELEESSLSSGANWFQTFKNVTLPLLKPGMLAGWILLFIAFSRELSASILLYSPRLEVLSVAIYDLLLGGEFRALSALAFLQIGMALAMLALAKWVSGLDRTPGERTGGRTP
ncbi:ABC transporter permease [Propylenella binzhouense]|uniref:Iron ABC transporter permease n=1 Tax=Propylenella binzhouense TaxID=2555902 RepID=A0A964WT92_9HYPH|nr:iron ABC transporter permease [Propylenella binzhouense]MYZ47600.1 iron ABC transporter permease [Propylenella binzhouense]